MIGTKKMVIIKNGKMSEFICYDMTNQYYKFVCIEKTCSVRFIKIPIIANIASDYVHNNQWINDNDYNRASP